MSHRENKSVFHSSKILIKLKTPIGILIKKKTKIFTIPKRQAKRHNLTLPPIMTVLATKAWVGSFFIPAKQTEVSQVRQLEPDTPEPCTCRSN